MTKKATHDVSSAFFFSAFYKDLSTIGPSLYIHPLRRPHSQFVLILRCLTQARYLGDTLRASDFSLSSWSLYKKKKTKKNLERSKQQNLYALAISVARRINCVRLSSRRKLLQSNSSNWHAITTRSVRNKHVTWEGGRKRLKCDYFRRTLFCLALFPCTWFASWIILGGCERLLLPSWERKKDTTATISEGYVLQGENPQKAIIILCQTRKDTDN